MTEHRKRMEIALRQIVVPDLRRRGFKGRFPHFRRLLPDRIDYLMFQFYSSGGSFVIEIGRTGPKGFKDGTWQGLAPEKITVAHIGPKSRTRIKAGRGRQVDDSWFEFGPRSYEEQDAAKEHDYYKTIAERIPILLDNQAETWWTSEDFVA
jgi:uncharacterized protein DUF4304